MTKIDDFQQSYKEPLDINNLLLRGSVLRKTPWVIGMAINVGNDSKIVQNMTKAPRKVRSTHADLLRFRVPATYTIQQRQSRLPAEVHSAMLLRLTSPCWCCYCAGDATGARYERAGVRASHGTGGVLSRLSRPGPVLDLQVPGRVVVPAGHQQVA